MRKLFLSIAIMLIATASIFASKDTLKATTNLSLELSGSALNLFMGFANEEKELVAINQDLKDTLETVALTATDSGTGFSVASKTFYLGYYASAINKNAAISLKFYPLSGKDGEETVYLDYTFAIAPGEESKRTGTLIPSTTSAKTDQNNPTTAKELSVFSSNLINGLNKGNIKCTVSIDNEEMLKAMAVNYTAVVQVVLKGV